MTCVNREARVNISRRPRRAGCCAWRQREKRPPDTHRYFPPRTSEGSNRSDVKYVNCFKANWRTGWDSNPRYPRRYAGFQDRCLQPLGHPSVS